MALTTAISPLLDTESWTGSDSPASQNIGPRVPVYGLGTYAFHLVHGLALVSLGVSIVFSAGVLFYMLFPWQRFTSRPIGERLVVYLALCDLMFSISHCLDHSYMVVTLDHPPDAVCTGFAFVLFELVLAQSLVVLFTAVNAMCLVVLEKRVPTGRGDWGLILYALGIPFLFAIAALLTGYLGPAGPW